MINGAECTDPTLIIFFDKIIHFIPHIDNDWRDCFDADFHIEELDSAVQNLKLNKRTGPDGLTANFYKFFWNDIRILLYNAFVESIEDGFFGPTINQGPITLIPKPDKDMRYMDNFHPITLLNNDYKVFTHIYVNRLKVGINDFINESQSGFLKGRSIHNNIRLVMDLVDYSHLIDERPLT